MEDGVWVVNGRVVDMRVASDKEEGKLRKGAMVSGCGQRNDSRSKDKTGKAEPEIIGRKFWGAEQLPGVALVAFSLAPWWWGTAHYAVRA
jgi:hypothetical protein